MLFVGVHLTEGDVMPDGLKDRIIAEAVLSPWRPDHLSGHLAFEDHFLAIGPDDEALQIAGEPVETTSAHGAGDVFTGVIATALALDLSFPDAIQAANHAAAAHVSGQAWDKVLMMG